MFGRDKLPGSHTGTKGVGSYDRESKTLYVNYGGAGHLGAPVIRELIQVRTALSLLAINALCGFTADGHCPGIVLALRLA